MKKITALLLAAALMLSLAACGSGASAAPETTAAAAAAAETEAAVETGFVPALDTDMEATLYFAGSWGNFEALDQVALNFREYYPNVEVVYSKLSDYRSDLANKFATGEEIDLFMTDWWDAEYPANRNIIDNAEDLNASGIDFSGLNAELCSLAEVDGAQVMVPVYLQFWGFMVNQDLFADAGVEIPASYDELQAACEALSAAGYEQPIYVNSSQFGRTFIGYYMECRLAGSDETTALNETIARADELYAAGYVSTEGDTLADDYEAIILRFFEGDIPMVPISASKFSGTLKREAKSETFTASPFSYAYIAAPYGAGSIYADQLGAVYVGVYKDSKQTELANEFLRFMLTDEQMLVLQTVKNMPTANVNNGLDNFPYYQGQSIYCNTEEGISSLDEEYIQGVLALYKPDESHEAMYEKLEDYLANGLN